MRQSLTATNEKVGPRNYLAPELEDGRLESVTPACDVYSLGKLLYWIVAGRIFSREKHREAGWDLAKSMPGSAGYFLNELFDRTILANPAERTSMAELFELTESIAHRLQHDALPLDLKAKLECRWCRSGNYKVVLNVDSRHQQGGSSYFLENELGWNPRVQSRWIVLCCNECGNVQIFRPDHAKSDNWQPKFGNDSAR